MERRLIRVLAILFALCHIAASCPGTETGNPGNASEPADEGGGTPNPSSTQSAIDELIDILCLRVNECDASIGSDTCTDALNGTDGDQLGDEFGLPDGEFTIEGIRNGLDDGSIVADSTALGTCEGDLSEVSCSEVTANVSSDNFSNIENFIPISCADVFSLPE